MLRPSDRNWKIAWGLLCTILLTAEIVTAQTPTPLELFAPNEGPSTPDSKPVSTKENTEESPPKTQESAKSPTEVLAAPQVPAGPTKADLETRLQQISASVDLDEALKTQISDLLKRAISRIDEEKLAAQRIEVLQRQATTAPEDIINEQAKLEKLVARPTGDAEALRTLTLEELRSRHRQAFADLAILNQQLQSMNEQVDRWGKRIAELPTLIATSRTALAEAEKQLAEIGLIDKTEDPLIAARRAQLQSRINQLQTELKLFDTETLVAEDAQKLLSLQRDSTAREQMLKQKQVETLQSALADAEKSEAMKKADQAEQAAENADKEIKDAAQLNVELANKKTQMLEKLEQDRKAIVEAREKYLTREAQFTETRDQAEAAQFSEEIGLLLRNEKNDLPNTNIYHQESEKRRNTISELTVEILKWENERRKLLDLDAAVQQYIELHADEIPGDDTENIQEKLREVFNDRVSLYRDLTETARKRLNRLSNLEVEQMRLADLIEKHAAFVSEHVLWVPSTTPIWNSPEVSWSERLLEAFDLESWKKGFSALVVDVKKKPIATIPIWMLVAWLVYSRRRIKNELSRLGNEASRPNATLFAPTANAVMLTVLIATPVALMALWASWRLTRATPIGEPIHVFGKALFSGGLLMYGIDFVRHLFRTDGLAQDHFDWDIKATHIIRRGLIWSARIMVPCAVIVIYTELRGDELMTTTLGRLAFATAMLTASVILGAWLNPNSTIMAQLTTAADSWLARVGCYLVPLLAIIPLLLMAGSLAGYHYAAVQLSWRFIVSVAIVSLLIFTRALLMRWLLITYRRVAIARARERREALAAAKESTPEMPSDAVGIIESSGHVQLSDLNRQAQSFVRLLPILLGAFGLYLTWSEFFPALGIVHRYPLWLNVMQTGDADTGPIYVTLGDVVKAIISVVLTVVACRNVPGLMDITILQRLPLDAGARYAASALSRYVMIIVGALATFNFLGVSWGSVQWLVAAMTVGLGFGLQEIFANFVSGIILLFERPARVGDTVTIGNVTGTVTKIRIRATTILDWDNKELIVPNKEFVTGNLVNWTLTNAALRLVTTIGVAYGSDTRLTTELLYRAAHENTLVLDDPEPVVVFSSFAESSLNFELRVFVNGLLSFRRLKHDLHIAIDDLFRKHKIEIAFPQRDLHIRSVEGFDPAVLIRSPGDA